MFHSVSPHRLELESRLLGVRSDRRSRSPSGEESRKSLVYGTEYSGVQFCVEPLS